MKSLGVIAAQEQELARLLTENQRQESAGLPTGNKRQESAEPPIGKGLVGVVVLGSKVSVALNSRVSSGAGQQSRTATGAMPPFGELLHR